MKMNGRTLIIFCVILGLLIVLIWPSTKLEISSVTNGNTIKLSNGATIQLLGVESTEESRNLLDSIVNTSESIEVELLPDESAFFETSRLDENSKVGAYVILPNNDYECINSMILKKGKARFVENCVDSAYDYAKYSQNQENNRDLTPTIVEPMDYEEDEIRLPSYVPNNERKYSTWYSDGNRNLEMIYEACDYDLPYTKSFANQLAGRAKGEFNIGQVCEIFKYCYRNWKYVNDPSGHEYVARASESIASSLTGDCDDYAVLLASCMLAIGGDVCLNTGCNRTGGHAFAEVDISNFDLDVVMETIQEYFPEYSIYELYTRTDNSRIWLNLDWQAAYPGGKYYDCSSSWDTYTCINGLWKWIKLR